MKKHQSMSADKAYKLFIYVVLIALTISILVPIGWVFLASLKEPAEFFMNPWKLPQNANFNNFMVAFKEAKMGDYFLNSIFVTFMGIAILLITALPAAYVLARFDFKFKKQINGLFMAGLFINVNYIVIPIFLMLLKWNEGSKSLLNMSLFINNRFTLAVVYAATALPFTVYLLSGYFKTLPKAFEEAASIDGCTYFQTMTKIMIPMAKPSIVTVILFNFLSFWNEYIIALTLMPGAQKTLPVGLINLQQAARGAANPGPLYAGLVIVMLPTLILYIFVQNKLTQGMTLGGVKD
ncbi:carbohydrate ABC transporter permease [Erysipelothrix tonsillarum]|uniref:carbohydrate ABC transporter permease n=1 Tax=Erysipelothrix tonsillarum TaxID=38402 RepID=UPI00035D6F59|nr:carbohydrate ABC transporter permease [Erysipelothrix tonsillarum]